MVRVNIIHPRYLADQHLVAEYLEIIMLLSYVRKHPVVESKKMPEDYCLDKGHIIFFKNKIMYLKKRHELLKKEMRKRGFAAKKSLNCSKIRKELIKDWYATKNDKEIIKERLLWKINKKPNYYRYYGKRRTIEFWKQLIKNAS